MGTAQATQPLAGLLVADSDPQRAAQVTRLCTDAGLPCQWVGDGAAALERALAEPPALILARTPLPVLDLAQLTCILRSNPRTRGVRFAVQGEVGRRARQHGDISIPPNEEPERLLARLGALLAAKPAAGPNPAAAPPEAPICAAADPAQIGPSERPVGLFDDSQAQRLRNQLRRRAPDAAQISGKIVLVASEAESVARFVEGLSDVDGVWPSGREPAGRPGSEMLGHAGYVQLGRGIGLDLVAVPADPRFAPIWPLAGQAALGVFFLIDPSAAHPGRGFEGVAAAFRACSRAPQVSVLLLDAERPPDRATLRDKLPRIEAASLCALPFADRRADAGALRKLFSRVVP